MNECKSCNSVFEKFLVIKDNEQSKISVCPRCHIPLWRGDFEIGEGEVSWD